MKNIILILIIGLLAWSCKAPQIITQTETKTVYRDTIVKIEPIRVHLPQSRVEISGEMKLGNFNMPKQRKTEGLIVSELWVEDGVPMSSSWLRDSSILAKPEPITIPGAIQEKIITKTITLPPKRYVPKLHKTALGILIFEIIVLLGWLGIKSKLGNLLGSFFSKFSKK